MSIWERTVPEIHGLPKGAAIDVSGVKVCVWSKGEGRTLLYLHPGSGLHDHGDFLDALSKRYHVIAPAHPGFDGSQRPSAITSVSDLAFFYLDFIEQLDLRNIVLVGSSFGGWIAAELATMAAERITGLALVDPVGIKVSDRMTRDILDLFSIPLYDHPKHLFHGERRNTVYVDYPRDVLVRLAANHDAFTRFAWSPTLYNPKLRERLHRIKVPSLLVWGEEDCIVNVGYGKAFSNLIAGSQLVTIKSAGHYSFIDRAPSVVDHIASKFL